MSYLLAAEADKIQDFVFRSSRLREVSGASWLLTQFCREGLKPLREKYGAREIVNDGGSFRLVFDTEANARAFGQDLAEFYRQTLGGSLSVAEPVAYDGDFRSANSLAGEKLRRAKEHRPGVETPAHMPFVAYCASCGVELAVTHGHLAGENAGENEDKGRYLCQTCMKKAEARDAYRMNQKGVFIEAIQGAPIEQGPYFDWPEDAGDVGKYDLSGRNYVAYLVADGNGMGQLFGQCNEVQVQRLSERLPEIVKESLAEHTGTLIGSLLESGDRTAPVMPLLLGGDDVFVLLPASYALDFARRFCLRFEEKMDALLKEPIFADLGQTKVTMSAAVVICKSKYPYALAHRRGEDLLKEAKRMSKRLAAAAGKPLSAVNFEVILGNRLAGQEDDVSESLRTTLKPYWVSKDDLPQAASYLGERLKPLLEHRLALKDVPNKRLHELRSLFDAGALPEVRDAEQHTRWKARVERILARSRKHQQALTDAFQALGGEDVGAWRSLHRGDNPFQAHGFLDLLEAWHFAQDLDHLPEDYEPQEENET